jgi:hypothetical protein
MAKTKPTKSAAKLKAKTAKAKPATKKPTAKSATAKSATANKAVPTKAKTFSYFASDGSLNISADKPAQGTEAQILDAIQDLRAVRGNFLGIIVPSGTLQFYCDGDEWLIDVPVPAKGGSLQRTIAVDSMETTRMEYAESALAGTPVIELPKLKFKKF